jgi:hypothetical protein
MNVITLRYVMVVQPISGTEFWGRLATPITSYLYCRAKGEKCSYLFSERVTSVIRIAARRAQ